MIYFIWFLAFGNHRSELIANSICIFIFYIIAPPFPLSGHIFGHVGH
jgi:hypothetical protein